MLKRVPHEFTYELSRTKLDHYSDPDCISLLVGWGWVGGVGGGLKGRSFSFSEFFYHFTEQKELMVAKH